MNLITDPWIPVRSALGARLISPLELADPHDPALELAAIRPDFNGGLAQCLVGLMQLIAPDHAKVLQSAIRTPEKYPIENLRAYAQHFELDSGPRRFMQDMDFDEDEALPLSAMLIDAAGENTIKNNADLFIKRRAQLALTIDLAAQALLTLQLNAPSGGQGHRTSLRGGGPISMLYWPRRLFDAECTLLQKLLLNVFPHHEDASIRTDVSLPWTASCITSEGSRDVLSSLAKVNPSPEELRLLCYFATPRRIRLAPSTLGRCDLSTRQGPVVSSYYTKNFGANYQSQNFRHPLSPYYRNKSDELPLHLNDLGFSYRDWIHTVRGRPHADEVLAPEIFDHARLGTIASDLPLDAIWAFGYLMDNMKCLAWHEARFPVFHIAEEQQERVLHVARQLIAAAEATRAQLAKALRRAWSKSSKGDTTVAERMLFARSEAAFYEAVRRVSEAPEDEDVRVAQFEQLRLDWLKTMRSQALQLFSEFAEREDVAHDDLSSIERAANAHRSLLIGIAIEVRAALSLTKSKRRAA